VHLLKMLHSKVLAQSPIVCRSGSCITQAPMQEASSLACRIVVDPSKIRKVWDVQSIGVSSNTKVGSCHKLRSMAKTVQGPRPIGKSQLWLARHVSKVEYHTRSLLNKVHVSTCDWKREDMIWCPAVR